MFKPTYTGNEITKIVFTKKSKGKQPKQPKSDEDLDIENLDDEDEEKEDEEDIDDEDENKDEDEGKDGEGKEGKDKEGKEKEEEDKEGKDKEGKDKEGKDKEGKDKEGKEGEKKDGKSGKGGKSGKSELKEEEKDIESILKQAQELGELMKSIDRNHTGCGSTTKREDAQKEFSDKSPDEFEFDEEYMLERIKKIIQEAADKGIEHPFIPMGRSRGEGGGDSSNAPTGEAIFVPMRKPEFLEKMQDFAKKEYQKKYFKKGTDWFNTQYYSDIQFKDRPKVSVPKKSLYILVDVSGSMFSDFGDSGKSLLEHIIGYLPTIAEDDFVGQVWWISKGILHWQKGKDFNLPAELDGLPARTELSFFKNKDAAELTLYFKQVQGAKGSGGGTTFNKELQLVQNIREEEQHNAPIIVLTDGIIDSVKTQYAWPVGSGNKIEGKLPPNTYFMTDPDGISYMKNYYSDNPSTGYFDYEKNIQYYDITENGRFKVDLTSLGKW